MDGNDVAILSLLVTSSAVRILPAIFVFNFSARAQYLLHDVIPAGIFTSLVAYILILEWSRNPLGSFLAFGVIFISSVAFGRGLMITTIFALVVYYASV